MPAAKGMKVEIVGADHQNKPDVGSISCAPWIDIDKVDVIVDVPTSSVALAVNEIVRDKNKVFLVSGAAASDLTGPKCTPNTVHWTYDTWALANGTGRAIVKTGGDTWFFITADYAFGHGARARHRSGRRQERRQGARQVRHPLPRHRLLVVPAAGAGVEGQGHRTRQCRRATRSTRSSRHPSSASSRAGQTLAGLLVFLTDVKSLGLQIAQGLVLTEAWYWDQNDTNREFAKKFAEQNHGIYPTMVHAGVYSSVIHYLKAVEALKSDADGAAVVAKMKEMPTDDKLFGKGTVRADRPQYHPMYLFEVKKPSESKVRGTCTSCAPPSPRTKLSGLSRKAAARW